MDELLPGADTTAPNSKPDTTTPSEERDAAYWAKRDAYWTERNALIDVVRESSAALEAICQSDRPYEERMRTPGYSGAWEAYCAADERLKAFDEANGGAPIV